MTLQHPKLHSCVVIVTTAALLLTAPSPVALSWQTTVTQAKPTTPATPTTQAKPATPPATAPATQAKPVAKPAATSATKVSDAGWPRDYDTPSGAALRVYQPQVSSWNDKQHIVMYAAVAYTPKGAPKPANGTIKLEADTSVALSERLVNFTNAKLAESNFPGLPADQLREVTTRIQGLIPAGAMIMSLERVLAGVDKSQILPKNVEGVKSDPPTIFYSHTPAVFLNLDGDPVWSPITGNDLKFAVNTNWDLLLHEPTATYFLRHEKSWMTAKDVKGPWTPVAEKLPESFSKLPKDENWKDVRDAVPGKKLKAEDVPKVFVSTTPAELILLSGVPVYQAVAGTNLLWVSNTDSDVFRLGKTGPVFYLISGRWFTSAGFEGPWTFATPSLPPEFQKIPLEHPRSRVLASVPGTSQAAEAVLLAQVPQTAKVSKTVKAPDVDYDGDPKFEPIPSTKVSRAVNTDKDVLNIGDYYYLCFQGVWFVSKSAKGPWEVTGTIPQEIYSIPVSSPAYPVTSVTVVEDNSDAVVFATAAAYTGVMIAWGCAVWGSGYYYPPYVRYGPYPMYYGYGPTYGFHASYNPWTGAYSRGASVYGPYGGAGMGARYNPSTGAYSRGAVAYGPYGARGAAQAYNPRTGGYAATRQGAGVYGSWGQTGVQRGDQWATSSRVTNNVTGQTTRFTQGSGGGEALTRTGPGADSGIVRTGSGDVYAGRDGNVYKKEGSGWTSANGSRPDTATTSQLNRDAASRSEGARRTVDSGTARSTGSSSYRPRAGGGGGGGRRR